MLARILCSTAMIAALGSAASAEVTVHILHTNDTHSRIQPINRYDSTCAPEDDAAGDCFGGVARVATAINDLRDELTAAGENVVVMNAGDRFQGSLIYTTFKGDVEAEMMEAIGYDVMAVGNHEFDDGPKVLRAFMEEIEFPILLANADISAEPELADTLKPSAVILHPLPRREEIATAVDHSPHAVYWRQMRNGMWIRAALIATLFRKDNPIREYFESNGIE